MKKNLLLAMGAAGVLALYCLNLPFESPVDKHSIPDLYFRLQRAYPFEQAPANAYYAALDRARARGAWPLEWSSAGPSNIGGRITDVEIHPLDPLLMYAGAASGGLWKSTDAGDHWAPVGDALPSLSIGDIALHPDDPETVYCGTGEANGGGGSVAYDGRGVFKSTDGGQHWQALGLEECGSIGRIVIDPTRPDRVFVAAMGQLFGPNAERGVYRSLDGGQHWEQTLFAGESVGAVDLAIDPLHPDTLYAATWERTREPGKRSYGGPGSGVWRSIDGGKNWSRLESGLPKGDNVGRIGIAVAPSAPHVVYATIAFKYGGFAGVYQSTDAGENWTLLPTQDPGYSSYGWWFGQIRVSPDDANHLFNLGIDWLESPDGGENWFTPPGDFHADFHALCIHPTQPQYRAVGTDGGIYVSKDGGNSWSHRPLPITQFYTSEIDYQFPHRFSGGAQDNGTLAALDGGIDHWTLIGGGDGFVTRVHPQNNSIYYRESQYGGFSGSNGATAPLAKRYNWNTPYLLDPSDPSTLYFGAERLFKSTDGGLHWVAVSDDLTNGPGPTNEVIFGTITTVDVSPLDRKILLAGTDDGNVWASSDGGQNWNKVNADLPKRWVTAVVADRWDAQTAYVCLSGYRNNEDMAHIYRTTDLGQHWTPVTGDLPDVPVNDLILDPLNPLYWYAATDVGVFATFNGGTHWLHAGEGMPPAPVTDLTFHAPTRTLLAATFGRSMYTATAPLPSAVAATPLPVKMQVTPNPVSEVMEWSVETNSAQKGRLELWNLEGCRLAVLYEGPLEAGVSRRLFPVGRLDAGIYLLRWQSGGAVASSCKVVKVR